MNRPGLAWVAVCAGFAAASILLFVLGDAARWTLQPARAAFEPWRLLSGALWHWNGLHLLGNLGGLLVIAVLGWRAGLPLRAALAWLLAWPLTQALLLLHPAMPEYAGLSGVLHAGVLLCGLHLRQPRWLGHALLAGLGIKLLLEQPWGPLLRPNDWWGGATLPLAHAAGAGAGLLAAALCRRRVGRLQPPR